MHHKFLLQNRNTNASYRRECCAKCLAPFVQFVRPWTYKSLLDIFILGCDFFCPSIHFGTDIPYVHVPYSGGCQVLQYGDYSTPVQVLAYPPIYYGWHQVAKGISILCSWLHCTPAILVFQSIPPWYFQGTCIHQAAVIPMYNSTRSTVGNALFNEVYNCVPDGLLSWTLSLHCYSCCTYLLSL
jgi:hypothetical protein